MARVTWSAPGERRYEYGVDRGMLYTGIVPGVPWNGLTKVDKTQTGGAHSELVYDGVKYFDYITRTGIQLSVESVTTPLAFDYCRGRVDLAPGLTIENQPARSFDFSYRTLKGNDLDPDHGYKIHVVYGCTAVPGAKTNVSNSVNVSLATESWTFHTMPQHDMAPWVHPFSMLTIDSNETDPYTLQSIEDILYGSPSTNPRIPAASELTALLTYGIYDPITDSFLQ